MFRGLYSIAAGACVGVGSGIVAGKKLFFFLIINCKKKQSQQMEKYLGVTQPLPQSPRFFFFHLVYLWVVGVCGGGCLRLDMNVGVLSSVWAMSRPFPAPRASGGVPPGDKQMINAIKGGREKRETKQKDACAQKTPSEKKRLCFFVF